MTAVEKIKRDLAGHKEELAAKFNVGKIGIFGSYARGEQGRRSDVDILVEFKASIGFFKFITLEEYLSKILKKRVDLVTKKALKPYIKQDVLKEVVYA